MNELVQTNVMQASDVAEILGVTTEAILKHARKLFPEVIENGKAVMLTAAQVTEIKRHMRPTTKVAGAVTELEKQETIIKAMQYLQDGYNAMKQRAEEAERRNAVLMHTTKLYTVTEIAKELGLNSAERLNKILEEKGVQYKVNGTWVPTCKYSSAGYFEIKQEVHDNGYVYYDRKVTQDGRVFILDLCGAMA